MPSHPTAQPRARIAKLALVSGLVLSALILTVTQPATATDPAAATQSDASPEQRRASSITERAPIIARARTAAQRLRQFWSPILSRPALPADAPKPNQKARIELGRRLFFDTRLSIAHDMSCATCHRPNRGYADGQARRIGRRNQPLPYTVPSLWNVEAATALTWTGLDTSLEHHVDRPLTSADEMAANWPTLLKRLANDSELIDLTRRGFGSETRIIKAKHVRLALAAYQRTLRSPRTRFDDWLSGDDSALTPREQSGFILFVGRAGCVSCHGGWRFSDDRRHDIGLSGTSEALKTPGLRGIGTTAPYMHDGRFETLQDVVTHYARIGRSRQGLLPGPATDRTLDRADIEALIAFLQAL